MLIAKRSKSHCPNEAKFTFRVKDLVMLNFVLYLGMQRVMACSFTT